jgi:hypothetical protein
MHIFIEINSFVFMCCSLTRFINIYVLIIYFIFYILANKATLKDVFGPYTCVNAFSINSIE